MTQQRLLLLAAPFVISSAGPRTRPDVERSHERPASSPSIAQAATCPADLVIRNGSLLDGTGAPAVSADVAISGDRITAVSRTPLPSGCGRTEIDATGLTVAPGFIDLHAHIEPLASMPDAASEVRQGVTLAIGGPDGGGPSPFGA